MTKKQNVLAAIEGRAVEGIPAGFWLHFPAGCECGDASFGAHMDFFAKTGTDITKIMNESIVPYEYHIRCAADWRQLKPFTKNSPWIKNQIELSKRIIDAVGEDGFVLQTVHGIVASAWHARGGSDGYDPGKKDVLANWLREDPEAVCCGWDVITDGLCILVEECERIGIDGIYYAALGGEDYLFTDEEHEKYIKPRDIRIINAAKSSKVFLHICKDHINLDRFVDYPCDVVNWGTHDANPGLEEGAAKFPDKVILGGLQDRKGVLVDGSTDDIACEARGIAARMAHRRFMLGADCTLPTEINYARIRAAAEAVK